MPERGPDGGALQGREYGVLLHATSLPGATEYGALGRAADHFLDWLNVAGAGVWQLLPLGPVGDDGSPYFARSTHAGNPRLIDLEELARAGWLTLAARGDEPFAPWHARQVQRAAQTMLATAPGARAAFDAWVSAEAYWLEDYALATVLRSRAGNTPWWTWAPELRDRQPAALAKARADYADECALVSAEQYFFHRQWRALHERAAARGVRLFGDMPIYLAPDAVDVWAHRELFQLDAAGRPTAVAGVPPDYFAVDGQLWGNPLYRWEVHEATGFRWWLERLAADLKLCDFVRIDHFRALEAYWSVPAGSTARVGTWCLAPGDALLRAARVRFGRLPVVAEDLGVITTEVEALRDAHGLPGMRVLQFGFDGNPANPHLPHNWHPDLVAYSGTHDNDTLCGWLRSLDEGTRASVAQYVGSDDLPAALLRWLFGSVPRLVVLPMQDLLGLGAEARMNTPGTVVGNWSWMLHWDQVPASLAARTRELAARYGRVAG